MLKGLLLSHCPMEFVLEQALDESPQGSGVPGSMQPREHPSLFAPSSLPRGRAGCGADSSWLGVSSLPGVSVPCGIASCLPRPSAGRPVQTCSCPCGEGLTLAARDWILLVRWKALGSDSSPCFSWRPALGGFSLPLSASESCPVSCLGVGALAMAGSRVSSDVPQQARLLVPLSTKLTSFPSRLGDRDDRRLPGSRSFQRIVSEEEGPSPSFVEQGG